MLSQINNEEVATRLGYLGSLYTLEAWALVDVIRSSQKVGGKVRRH